MSAEPKDGREPSRCHSDSAMESGQPIFAAIFGAAWPTMPTVFRQHYANRPFTRDVVTVEGKLAVEASWLMRAMAPILRLTGTLAPYSGTEIPVTVAFRSEHDSGAFCFDRTFHFPGRPAYRFRSRMVPIGGTELIEWMGIGIGWRTAITYQDGRVMLRHRGYALRFFGRALPLPLAWIIGRGEAFEEALDARTFRMAMSINHGLFGKVYGYSGTFRIGEVRLGP